MAQGTPDYSGQGLFGVLGGILNNPIGSVTGGAGGGAGFLQGLWDEEAAKTGGFNALWEMFGLSGIMPKGTLATLRDAAPIAGSIAGNMFFPYFGGTIGSAAGNMAGGMAFGQAGDQWKQTPMSMYQNVYGWE